MTTVEQSDDIELWRGDEVVRGMATPRHQVIRGEIAFQLRFQLAGPPSDPRGTHDWFFVPESTIETDDNAPRSDGAILDGAGKHLLWIEVTSPSDFTGTDYRLVGADRYDFLVQHVDAVWTFQWEVHDVIMIVHGPDGRIKKIVTGDQIVTEKVNGIDLTIDLGELTRRAARAPGDWAS